MTTIPTGVPDGTVDGQTGAAPSADPPAPSDTGFALADRFAYAPEFARIREGTAILATGTSGPAVTVLKQALQELGFLSVDAQSGDIFGNETAGALATFQRQNGLPPSGVLDGETLRQLSAALDPGPQGPDTVAGDPGPLTQEAYQRLVNEIPQRLHLPAQIVSLEAAPQGRIPTPGELDQFEHDFFEEENPELTGDLGGLKEIPFGYIPDGCYARAHIMDEILGNHGVDNAKIFAVGSLHAGDGNKYFPNGTDWGWHVAPLVVVNDNGRYDLRVVDPALDEHPITPEEWISRVDPSMSMIQVQVTNRGQYMPEYGSPSGEAFDANLASADGTLQSYMSSLEQIAAEKGLPDPADHYSGVVDTPPPP